VTYHLLMVFLQQPKTDTIYQPVSLPKPVHKRDFKWKRPKPGPKPRQMTLKYILIVLYGLSSWKSYLHRQEFHFVFQPKSRDSGLVLNNDAVKTCLNRTNFSRHSVRLTDPFNTTGYAIIDAKFKMISNFMNLLVIEQKTRYDCLQVV
jgi:hypothetical protein